MTLGGWTLVAALLIVTVVTTLWCVWTATRLDRLHLRCAVAAATLEEQALRRAVAAQELSHDPDLDLASAVLVGDAAHGVLHGPDGDFWQAQSDLTAALHAVDPPPGAGPTREVLDAARRLAVARRIHDDLVTSTRDLRSRRRVRWFRLAGHAAAPQTVGFDDRMPPYDVGRR